MTLTDSIQNTVPELWELYKGEGSIIASVTFTLKPELYKKRARTQFLMTNEKIIEVLKHVSKTIIMIPELTKQTNIHYHALIQFANRSRIDELIDICKMSKISKYITPYVNNNYIKSIETFTRTYNYIMKEYKRTSSLIKETEIIYFNKHVRARTSPPPSVETRLLDMIKREENDNTLNIEDYYNIL